MENAQNEPLNFEEIKKVYDNSTVHCAVVTGPNNKILYASQSFADALGYKLQELEGKPFHIAESSQVEPLLQNGVEDAPEELSKKGYVVQKNGTKAMVDYESVSVTDSNNRQFIFSRISNLEAYLLYNILDENRDTLENILNNLTISVVVIDPLLTIYNTNTTFIKTFELADNLPKQMKLADLDCAFWKNDEVFIPLVNNYAQNNYDFDAEFDWNKESGDSKSFKVLSRLIHKKEEKDSFRILLSITDITEEKANQTGRNQQIRHIMHELRNPLSNLSLCVELLADSTKENNQEDTNMFLSKAGNSIQRMKQLINDLNEFRTETK